MICQAISVSAPAYWKFLRWMDVLRRCRRSVASFGMSPTPCTILMRFVEGTPQVARSGAERNGA